jgi:hypothetical protein
MDNTGIWLVLPISTWAVVMAANEIVPLSIIVPPSSPVPAVMLVTVPPASLVIGTDPRLITRPLASMLRTGTAVPLPTLFCAVVMAANVAAAAPGPTAVTSPVSELIADVEVAMATEERLITLPLASTEITGMLVELPTLLCAVVIAARVGPG